MKNPKNLQDLADSLSEINYGKKLSEVQKKKICIQCEKKIEEFPDDESRMGHEIMGLCSICQREFLF